jgi:hypothetical protein
MKDQSTISSLSEDIKAIAQTQIALLKLQAVERTVYIGGAFFTLLIMAFIGILIILFSSLWLGFYFSNQLGDNYSGFGIITGFYGLMGFIFWKGRKHLIERPIRNLLVRKILNITI